MYTRNQQGKSSAASSYSTTRCSLKLEKNLCIVIQHKEEVQFW